MCDIFLRFFLQIKKCDNFIDFQILILYIRIGGDICQSRCTPMLIYSKYSYRTEFLRNLLNIYSEDSFRSYKICSLMYFSLFFTCTTWHVLSYYYSIRLRTVFWRRIIYCVKITLLFLRSWRLQFATLLAKLYTNRVSYIKVEIIPGWGAILLAA